MPNFLFSAVISWLCGFGSQLLLPSFSSCFLLSAMQATDAGKRTTQLASPVMKTVARGRRVPHLLAGSNSPCTPPAGPKGLPGKVAARTTGSVVCKPKYHGKVFV